MKDKINLNLNKINSLNEQSLDTFPHKPIRESLKATQKVFGIEIN